MTAVRKSDGGALLVEGGGVSDLISHKGMKERLKEVEEEDSCNFNICKHK